MGFPQQGSHMEFLTADIQRWNGYPKTAEDPFGQGLPPVRFPKPAPKTQASQEPPPNNPKQHPQQAA